MNPPVDYISELPDDLLIVILSKMPLHFAATTTLLSRRWKNLWTLVPALCFDGRDRITSLLPHQHRSYNSLEDDIKEINLGFKNWANQIIANHSAGSIHTFCLRYQLFTHSDDDMSDICEWLSFARAKGVRSLELDFSDPHDAKFISKIWGLFIPTEILQSFTLLTSLSLNKVHLNEKIINHFLYECSCLHRLRLHHVVGLGSVRIVGPFNCLTEIDICECHGDPFFEISATTLSSFKYIGRRDRLLLHSDNSIAQKSIFTSKEENIW